jgi:hypothetical protein
MWCPGTHGDVAINSDDWFIGPRLSTATEIDPRQVLRFVLIGFRPPQARPHGAAHSLMILMQPGVDSSFPQVLAAGSISPKPRFTSDLTATSLGVLTSPHQVTDKRLTTVGHFELKDHDVPKDLEGVT